MSSERPLVDTAEALVDTYFFERDKEAIRQAEKIADGKGCLCRNCVLQAQREGNFALDDLNHDQNMDFSYKTTLSQTGKLNLVRHVGPKDDGA